MASKTEQALHLFELMSADELRIISAVLQQRRTNEHIPRSSAASRFLRIPRELRDLIHYYTAFFHLRDVGIGRTPGLLQVNKQLRSEFSDVLYNTKVLKIRYYEDGIWKEVNTKKLLQALLECHDRMMVDFGGRLLGTGRDQAEALAEFNGEHIDRGARAGVLELAGTDGRSCMNIAFARSVIDTHAAAASSTSGESK